MSTTLTKSETKLVMHMVKFYLQLCVSNKKKQKAVDLYLKLEGTLS